MKNKFHPEEQNIVSSSLMGPESGAPCSVDSNNGRITRIRPYFYDKEYTEKYCNPWKIEALTGKQRQWFLEYIDRISSLIDAEGDHLYDIWCAYKYKTPLWWIMNAPASVLLEEIEDEESLKKLPPIRHMLSCQSHNELTRNVLLLIEQKKLAKLSEEIPYLTELRTARFAEQQA